MPPASPLSWNPTLGLCRQDGPGHTAAVAALPAVHNGVITVTHLCLEAQAGRLAPVTLRQSLASLRAMQVRESGERRGCFKWYWEEAEPLDTNAAFFIGLALQLLYLAERERLDSAAQAALREICAELDHWFHHELSHADPRYPNKCMGDLVCAWLGAAVLERPPSAQLLTTTRTWCAYWREQAWGWGEHLSDTYTMVLLTELSAVLLFHPDLPADIHTEFKRAFAELLAIDDAFTGQPRVPAIRSYAFTHGPEPKPFRGFIQAQAPGADTAGINNPAVSVRVQARVFGAWFHREGWARLDPGVQLVRPWVEIPCFGGARAQAVVRPDLRLGAMTHYPIMEGIEHPTWGLSWQSFPAALWRPEGDWLFWRWLTREDDRERAHPALDMASAYLGNALSTRVVPPPVPQQRATLSPAGNLTLRRTLPRPTEAAWNKVTDAFCVTDGHARVEVSERTLRLVYPETVVRVEVTGDTPSPRWEPRADGGWWSIHLTAADLGVRGEISHDWRLTLEH